MAILTPVDVIKFLSESLFHVGEKKRLRALRHHNEEREANEHVDLLSKVQGNACMTKHNQRMEHHGMEFWTYYYQGEHPDAVIQNEPVEGHAYGTEEQKLAIEKHMLDPEFAAYNQPGVKARVFDPGLIKRRWTGLMWVAEAALSRGNYKAAEATFRQALAESEKFNITEIGLFRMLSGLANSLLGLNRLEEAEPALRRAVEILSQFSSGQGKELAVALQNLARILDAKGSHDEAENLLEQAFKILERESSALINC